MYKQYVTQGPNGEPVLYAKLLKALYGLLRSALLFYKNLQADLENMGFTINSYDPCVANKIVNGKQMTVMWHVDDLKVSHVEEKEVSKFCMQLSDIYGSKIKVNHDKVHSYLGMNFDSSTKRQLRYI